MTPVACYCHRHSRRPHYVLEPCRDIPFKTRIWWFRVYMRGFFKTGDIQWLGRATSWMIYGRGDGWRS